MSYPAWSQSYHAVPSRTPLSRPPHAALPVQAAPPAKPAKVEWSPAVREYVGRAFESRNAIEGITKDEMTVKLKEIISYFAERSQLDVISWSTHPLPQELIRDERASAKPATTMSIHNGAANNSHVTSQSKKRKSQDSDELQTEMSIPPWRKTNNLEDRITFTGGSEKRQKKNTFSRDSPSKFDQSDLEKRKQRFNLGKPGNNNKSSAPWTSGRQDSDSDTNTAPVVGTNLQLEKSYFRLTAPPKAETVRPQHILEQTLQHVIRKWKNDQNYNYACNQLKSLRQDLTVQHIKNNFTVKAYEAHARIALVQGDMGEYNQCQTQLKALYSQNLEGNPAEFIAYRILYFVYTCNKTDMNDLLAELTLADKTHPWIKHALDVRSAVALGNYHRFFRLYLTAKNLGSYMIDKFIARERLLALANISRAYMTVTLQHITVELSFADDGECLAFLESLGAKDYLDQKVDEHGKRTTRVKVKECATLFENLRKEAFSKVDIKGQL